MVLERRSLPPSRTVPTIAELVALAQALEDDRLQGSRVNALAMKPEEREDDFSEKIGEIKRVANMRDAVDSALAPDIKKADATCSIHWSEACEMLGLPVSKYQDMPDGLKRLRLPVFPQDLADALQGVQITRETSIEWQSKRWLVVALCSKDLAKPFRLGDVIDADAVGLVSLVPVEHVGGLGQS